MSNLTNIITTIEQRSAVIEAAYKASGKLIYDRVKDREDSYRILMEDLAREYRANHKSGNTHVLTMSGIRVSCTSGISGLVHAWLGKARVQVQREMAGAA
ncbi:hypothetical protein ABID16_000071 [Rhizobium aquaticum]|uniref:Uncharacterized protein n=1 Tax=Rhizobium aquaticum TaxID=1549636 RepID=A0ABV2ITE6_9HYPH